MLIQVTELNHLSLRDFRELFTSLHVPGIETMGGYFKLPSSDHPGYER